MAPGPPPGFINLAEAYDRRDRIPYNVIGICTDYLPPAQSRGTDLVMKACIWDQNCPDSSEIARDGLTLRFFHKEKYRFPAVHENGDILILRNIKTLPSGSTWLGMSGHTTTWTVVSGSSLLDSKDAAFSDVECRKPYEESESSKTAQGPQPSLLELKYAKTLLLAKDPSTLRAPPKSTALDVATIMSESGGQPPALTRRKYRMIKNLEDPGVTHKMEFADLLGEVRRIWLDTNPIELRMTDYTENPLLFDYQDIPQHGDPYGYVKRAPLDCPPGKMTIRINMWDEHAAYTRELVKNGQLKLGMYMWVRNAQIKMDRGGTQLEAHMRGSNSNFGTAISLLFARDAAQDQYLKDLLTRKRDYEAKHKLQEEGTVGFMLPPQKRVSEEQNDQNAQKKPGTGKNARKRQKKKEQDGKATPGTSINQNVRCEALAIPLTSIAEILDNTKLQRKTPAGNDILLPFQNSKYKSKISIVDFFPDKLEDFATPYKNSDYEALSDHESDDNSVASLEFARRNPDDVGWQWHFFLMAEDPRTAKINRSDRPTMLLQVAGLDGDYLLNMEACDLRKNPQSFHKLKEKLFVMWGDLQEKKAEHSKTGQDLREAEIAVSSKPFECMIQEFGIQARSEDGLVLKDQWERGFRMVKTNVG